MIEYSYIAAVLALIGTVATAFLSYRGSHKAAELSATASSLNAQLLGWKSYCDELTSGMTLLRANVTALQLQLVEQEGHTRACKDELWLAQRRIKILEDRLGPVPC
jgi:hypothetical protein